MKGLILFTIVLVAIVLGHDAWVSYDKDLPFALSDFGWLLNNYMPQAEQYIIETVPEEYQGHIGMVLSIETLWVVCLLMGILLILAGFAKLSESVGDINLNIFAKSPSKKKETTSLRKRDQGTKLQYKRK